MPKLDLQPLDIQPIQGGLDLQPLDLQPLEEKSPGFFQGALGTGAAMADIVAGIPKVGARTALAVGGKIAEPSRSLQDTWDTAGQAIEETFPSFGKNMENNPGYTAPMKPFELYGKGAEWVAKNASFGNKDVEGAINIGANFAPIPFAGKAGRVVKKALETIDPGLKNVKYTKPLDLRGFDEIQKPEVVDTSNPIDRNVDPVGWEKRQLELRTKLDKQEQLAPTNELNQHELIDQPSQGRVANPYEAVTGDWRVDENGIPIKADLTMDVQNAQQPLQRNLWGDELPQKHPQENDLSLPEAIDSMDWAHRRGAIKNELTGEVAPTGEVLSSINEANSVLPTESRSPAIGAKGQRGVIDLDLLTFGLASKLEKHMANKASRLPSGTQMGERPPIPVVPVDSMQTPTTPETIAKKQEIRSKIEASSVLKKIAPEYSSITTPEEAITLSKNAKDITANPVRDVTISGINGQVMLHKNSPALNFTRYALQEARNIATKFSKDFITSDTGAATLLGKLKGDDLVNAMNVLTEAARRKVNLTKENIGSLHLPKHIEDAVLSVRKALQEQYVLASGRGRMEVGRSPFKELPGYMPGLMTGGYQSLVGVMKDGVFVTRAIAQADTRWNHKNTVKAFQEQLARNGEKPVVVPLKRKSLKQATQRNSLFNGFNDVINTIAKNDPRFAELQQAAQMKANQANHTLMNFNVHEMDKKGIRGVVGDSPIRTRLENAQDLRKGLTEFLEQGADYYAHQAALDRINQVVTSPDAAHLTNTRNVIEKHVKHVTGQDLNPIGNAANWIIDAAFNIAGVSGKVPLGAARELRTLVGLHMMGIYNPIFTALQFSQVLTSAIPEMAKVVGKLGIAEQASKSATNGPIYFTMLSMAKQTGKEAPSIVPQHMIDAFQYAQDHGIMSFSELENAQKASRNKYVVKAENYAAWPIALGEKGTRPPVFMMFADMFHQFGLSNEEAFMAAQHSTNMAMGDYHAAERPHIYSQLGVMGEFGGALTTFKHNALTNFWIKGRDAVVKDSAGNRHLTPALIALAGVALFQGIKGAPGYDDLDSVVQWATSQMGERKSISELALDDAPNWLSNGFLSATTGLDFQSRASMARILPETQWASLSPQYSVLANIGTKAYEYGQYQDQQSFNDFMTAITPSGMRGMTEEALKTDQQGNLYNSAGQLMYDQPRTEKEQNWRKYGAVRPLHEAQDSQDVYVKSRSLKEQEKALTTIATRYRQAFAANDQKGMNHLAQMYYDKDGDPLVLEDAGQKQIAIKQANQTQRERMAGMLEASIRSIKRHEKMQKK